MKLCLVCSSGGHLLEMYCLKGFWEKFDRFWVTFPGGDSQSLLKTEKVLWAYHPTNRSIKNLFRNLILAFKILRKEKPDVVISTGAGVGVPFIIMGRLFGIKTVFIDSITRIRSLSLSAKLVYPFVHQLYVQWPEVGKRYRKAIYQGQVI